VIPQGPFYYFIRKTTFFCTFRTVFQQCLNFLVDTLRALRCQGRFGKYNSSFPTRMRSADVSEYRHCACGKFTWWDLLLGSASTVSVSEVQRGAEEEIYISCGDRRLNTIHKEPQSNISELGIGFHQPR
jgi:hypothetical protein